MSKKLPNQTSIRSADANRRDFLRASAATVLGATAASTSQPSNAAEPSRENRSTSPRSLAFPPHEAVPIPGVHGYAQRSLAAGERLHIRISADVPYRLSIRRMGAIVDDRASDTELHAFDEAQAKPQPIHPGSYIHVAKALSADNALEQFTLGCWLRPWALNHPQGVITQWDNSTNRGIGLMLTSASELVFNCGSDQKSSEPCRIKVPFPAGHVWRHVVATWDGKAASLYLDGKLVETSKFDALARPAAEPLRIGAAGNGKAATQFLDADLAAPAIYASALSQSAIVSFFQARGLEAPASESLIAYWPFDEERGSTVRDASGNGYDGEIINRGTWMIGGPSFDATKVPRHAQYDPDADPKRGHGLRLAADDLYDCRWEVTQSYDVPEDSAPGIYTAEAEFEREGKPYRYPITFIVRRSPRREAAKVLVLAATNTWTAYSATPFAANTIGPQNWGTGGSKNSPADAPAYCCYRNHRADQPTYQLGLNMPWPAAGPEVLYSPRQVGYSHLARADRFLLAWLESEGVEFDVCSDHDLHRYAALLDDRKVVFVNGHSEYWSREAYEAVDGYLSRGGSLIVTSGNTMLWRVSFDDEVMECRKFDANIGGRPHAAIGEVYHTHDHRRGSLMRECGLPSWKVIGLEAAGWGPTGRIEEFPPYHVTDADHPLLTTPTPTDLRNGDTFGHAPDASGPRAIGHEWDIRLPRIVAMTESKPAGFDLPEEPAGVRTLAVGKRDSGTALDYFGHFSKFVDGVCAELIDWQRPQGGRVINFGSIGVGWALAADPKLQILMRNALHACGVAKA